MEAKQKENEVIAFSIAIVCDYINIKLSSRYGKLNKNCTKPNMSAKEYEKI